MRDMEPKHPLELAAFAVGGAAKLAGLIGVSAQSLSNWKERGVPIERCVAIEQATGGVVTRRDLRPNDWQAIWPELANDRAKADGKPAKRKNPDRDNAHKEPPHD